MAEIEKIQKMKVGDIAFVPAKVVRFMTGLVSGIRIGVEIDGKIYYFKADEVKFNE